MSIIPYKTFTSILNDTIFGKSKSDLLTKISENPYRYIGIFRPTKSKAKILQNLLQSHEIHFGDAFELIIEKYLVAKGCEILPKRYELHDGTYVDIDQCFKYKNKIYFVEQKVRDDHDSTKIRGQIQNFEKKLDVLLSIHKKERDLLGLYFCVDPSLVKNKKFFTNELEKLTQIYGIETALCYGKEFFIYLQMEDVWDEITEYLIKWREALPDIPEINFDIDAKQTFEEIKDLRPLVYRKLFDNKEIYEQIILTLFPQKETLKILLKYFKELGKEQTVYMNLYESLFRII
jgi:Holliday junction resolvase-like predicted endonuclease